MKQRKAAQWPWMLAAMTPSAMIAAETPWPWAALTGAVCGILNMLAVRWGKTGPRWVRFLYALLLVALLMPLAERCWVNESGIPAIGLTLLLLAAASTWKSGENANRTGNVIFWLEAILLGMFALAGLKDWKWQGVPTGGYRWELIPLLLLPTLGGEQTDGKDGWKIGIGTFLIPTVFALLATGQMPGIQSDGFRKLAQSVGVPGLSGRMDAVAACTMTLGFFAAMSRGISVGIEGLEGKRRGTAIIVLTAVGAIVAFTQLNAVKILVLWTLVCYMTNFPAKQKKVEKT